MGMKDEILKGVKKLAYGRCAKLFSIAYRICVKMSYAVFSFKWFLSGKRKPGQEEVDLVKDNVTFIFKSFERQNMAKRLFENIQSYYPEVKVIIADDSRVPLDLTGKTLEVIQLPFNSGLSYGLNKALEKVETPFVIRMDDDELLTPLSNFGKHLEFLIQHQEVDLVGVLPFEFPFNKSMSDIAALYYRQPMNDAPKRLKIPHMKPIEDYVVVGKPANIFIARTEKMREVGYDDNIRMIDHNDFFYRAAGHIVSVLDEKSFVFHYHDRFNRYYQRYREDVEKDRIYIAYRRWKDKL